MSLRTAMSSPPKILGVALVASLAIASADARAQARAPEPLYDPRQLPEFHGTLQLFTLTPRGDIDGFILADGTEVKTPPHLSVDLAAAVKPGDQVTIHGLKAASLPLVQAMSVGNDTTGAAVIDAGPAPDRAAPTPPRCDASGPTRVQGRLRMRLHGPRGDVNGALLEDGTVLKLPPPEAARFTAMLVAGTLIAAEGVRCETRFGTFVDLTAFGPDGGPLRPVVGEPRPDAPTAKPVLSGTLPTLPARHDP